MNYITKYLLKLLIILSLSTSLSLAETTAPKGQLPSYLIGPGDVLDISVWKEEGLQKEVLVRPDGAMTFPLADEILSDNLQIDNGYLVLPDGHGIGVEINETVIEKYPFIKGPWSVFKLDSTAESIAVTGDHSLKWIKGKT